MSWSRLMWVCRCGASHCVLQRWLTRGSSGCPGLDQVQGTRSTPGRDSMWPDQSSKFQVTLSVGRAGLLFCFVPDAEGQGHSGLCDRQAPIA